MIRTVLVSKNSVVLRYKKCLFGGCLNYFYQFPRLCSACYDFESSGIYGNAGEAKMNTPKDDQTDQDKQVQNYHHFDHET